MTYSEEFRWRCVLLYYVYGIPVRYISDILGPKPRSISRWYEAFKKTGSIEGKARKKRRSRWSSDVLEYVKEFVLANPTFFLEELQEGLKENFPSLKNISVSTICRALKHDLRMSRKILTKAARECVPEEVFIYKLKLDAIYSYPEQVIFIDETSKDGRHAFRRYAWSHIGDKGVVELPFARGKRISVMAAMNFSGFCGWKSTEGTFTRMKFHKAFCEIVIPKLNPWPLPNSIVIMDNAKIHMYKELDEAVAQTGAFLIFLPPYSPEFNPIEIGFGRLKAWIQKYANLVFPLYPELVLEKAMYHCTRDKTAGGLMDTFKHCGYGKLCLNNEVFEKKMNI